MLKFLQRRRRRSKSAKNDNTAGEAFENSANEIEVIETNPDPDLALGSPFMDVTKRQVSSNALLHRVHSLFGFKFGNFGVFLRT